MLAAGRQQRQLPGQRIGGPARTRRSRTPAAGSADRRTSDRAMPITIITHVQPAAWRGEGIRSFGRRRRRVAGRVRDVFWRRPAAFLAAGCGRAAVPSRGTDAAALVLGTPGAGLGATAPDAQWPAGWPGDGHARPSVVPACGPASSRPRCLLLGRGRLGPAAVPLPAALRPAWPASPPSASPSRPWPSSPPPRPPSPPWPHPGRPLRGQLGGGLDDQVRHLVPSTRCGSPITLP